MEPKEPRGAQEKTGTAFPPTKPLLSPPLRPIPVFKLKSILFPVALLPSSSSHLTHTLSVQSPPHVLHRFPQAHIARNPITSHEDKPSLIPLLFSRFSPFLLKLLSVSRFFFLPLLTVAKGRSPQPLGHLSSGMSLSLGSVSPYGPSSPAPWVPGFLCAPTLNSGCVDTVLVVLSHTAGQP